VETDGTLRERKKEATRQSLHEATLRLAVTHGLEHVTVEAVADEANVSRRTFSNYFANKEEALLYGDKTRVRQLLDEVRARPAEESAWQALRAGALTRYGALDQVDPQWLAQIQLVRRHPSVLAQQLAFQSALERELAVEIAARSPGGPATVPTEPLRSRIIAAAFLTTLRTAINVWVEQPRGAALSAVIGQALDLVEQPFG
jgi:AcrR family transcriptional regulator